MAVAPAPTALPSRDKGHRFGPIVATGLFRADLGDCVGTAEQRPVQSEDGDEVPVAGAGCGRAVRASPAAAVDRSSRRRPKRSASPATGSPPNEAIRLTAKRTPRTVPDSPAWSAIVAP